MMIYLDICKDFYAVICDTLPRKPGEYELD